MSGQEEDEGLKGMFSSDLEDGGLSPRKRREKIEEFQEWLEDRSWQFASSSPHEYIVSSWYDKGENTEMFLKFARFVWSEGYDQKNYGDIYTYLNVGDYRYWTMTDPHDWPREEDGQMHEYSYLINRAMVGGYPDEVLEENGFS